MLWSSVNKNYNVSSKNNLAVCILIVQYFSYSNNIKGSFLLYLNLQRYLMLTTNYLHIFSRSVLYSQVLCRFNHATVLLRNLHLSLNDMPRKSFCSSAETLASSLLGTHHTSLHIGINFMEAVSWCSALWLLLVFAVRNKATVNDPGHATLISATHSQKGNFWVHFPRSSFNGQFQFTSKELVACCS